MSEENVQLVRRAYEALNAGDVERLIELCDQSFELDMEERVFNPATFRGHDGIRRFYGEVRDVWEEYRWDPEELIDAGNQVVAFLRAHGRGRGSGLEVARRVAMVWTIAGERALGLRLYVDRAAALRAAGLPGRDAD
jgi:ketosteroid isomerase-like protein